MIFDWLESTLRNFGNEIEHLQPLSIIFLTIVYVAAILVTRRLTQKKRTDRRIILVKEKNSKSKPIEISIGHEDKTTLISSIESAISFENEIIDIICNIAKRNNWNVEKSDIADLILKNNNATYAIEIKFQITKSTKRAIEKIMENYHPKGVVVIGKTKTNKINREALEFSRVENVHYIEFNNASLLSKKLEELIKQ